MGAVSREEIFLRCPDVDVAQHCSSSGECPLLILRRISYKHTGRHHRKSLSATEFHTLPQKEDSLTIYNTSEI
ncbi:hypothetical protein LDENG_00021790 [Lucifuga dentata]|nr:hypothetical protein LDENG_00021790 [Lucifuga dentata]